MARLREGLSPELRAAFDTRPDVRAAEAWVAPKAAPDH